MSGHSQPEHLTAQHAWEQQRRSFNILDNIYESVFSYFPNEVGIIGSRYESMVKHLSIPLARRTRPHKIESVQFQTVPLPQNKLVRIPGLRPIVHAHDADGDSSVLAGEFYSFGGTACPTKEIRYLEAHLQLSFLTTFPTRTQARTNQASCGARRKMKISNPAMMMVCICASSPRGRYKAPCDGRATWGKGPRRSDAWPAIDQRHAGIRINNMENEVKKF